MGRLLPAVTERSESSEEMVFSWLHVPFWNCFTIFLKVEFPSDKLVHCQYRWLVTVFLKFTLRILHQWRNQVQRAQLPRPPRNRKPRLVEKIKKRIPARRSSRKEPRSQRSRQHQSQRRRRCLRRPRHHPWNGLRHHRAWPRVFGLSHRLQPVSKIVQALFEKTDNMWCRFKNCCFTLNQVLWSFCESIFQGDKKSKESPEEPNVSVGKISFYEKMNRFGFKVGGREVSVSYLNFMDCKRILLVNYSKSVLFERASLSAACRLVVSTWTQTSSAKPLPIAEFSIECWSHSPLGGTN